MKINKKYKNIMYLTILIYIQYSIEKILRNSFVNMIKNVIIIFIKIDNIFALIDLVL